MSGRSALSALAVAVFLGVAGCGPAVQPNRPVPAATVVASAGAVGSAASGASPSDLPSGPAPVPPLDPSWLAARAVSCDGQLFFSPAVLSNPVLEEDGVDGPSQALRAYLAEPVAEETLANRPPNGWRRVAQTATKVQFVAVTVDRRGLWVVGFHALNGTWELDLEGACAGEVQREPGLGAADWWLDAGFPPPTAGDSVLHAQLVERSCAGGRSPEGRVAPPSIAYLANAVVVTLSVRKLPGSQDCPGNPPLAIEIRLDEPLGDRRIVDGGVFPPRDPRAPRS